MGLLDTHIVDFVVTVRVNGLSVDDAVRTAENVSGDIDFRERGEPFAPDEAGHADITEWLDHPERLHAGRALDAAPGAYAVTVTRRSWCDRKDGSEEDYERLATGCRREGGWEAGLPASAACSDAIKAVGVAQEQAVRLDGSGAPRGRRMA